jgi:hypothetical protein
MKMQFKNLEKLQESCNEENYSFVSKEISKKIKLETFTFYQERVKKYLLLGKWLKY